jgi:hypothetical protein
MQAFSRSSGAAELCAGYVSMSLFDPYASKIDAQAISVLIVDDTPTRDAKSSMRCSSTARTACMPTRETG